jgi:hypothetical protein
VTIDSERFYQFVNSDDELTLVVRGHLSLEAVLNLILDRALPRGLGEELDSLRFPQRVDLALALGKLDTESRPVWMKINAIRNRFAHDFDAKITQAEARDTLGMLPAWWVPPPCWPRKAARRRACRIRAKLRVLRSTSRSGSVPSSVEYAVLR